MTDARVERLADLVANYSVEVKEDQEVTINGSIDSRPLVAEIYKQVLLAGGYPTVIFREDQLEDLRFRYGTDRQLEHIHPLTRYTIEKSNILIRIKGDRNPKHLAGVNPEKIAKSTAPMIEIMDIMNERIKKGEFNWALVPYPTDALAQEASMSLLDYEDFVYRACFANKEDPKEEWKKISKIQEKVINYLEKKSELHCIGDDTDITFCIEGRKWVNSDGRKNLPDGEVFTGPLEDSAEGVIRFTYPAIYSGNEVEDIKLTFKKGQVVEAHAQKGEDFLHHMIHVDEGAQRVGEIAIGTNYEITRFTKDILFDEKIGGTIHMALGRGIQESGSENRSAIHWDMLKDMKNGKIYADGEMFYENGAFLI
ncbi:MAG: aminopeptidase [Theionarchaea archaeon]|nr:aminopeptidase [Theionarchaea archaeon]